MCAVEADSFKIPLARVEEKEITKGSFALSLSHQCTGWDMDGEKKRRSAVKFAADEFGSRLSRSKRLLSC